jgi:hypothetical protein
VLFFDGSIKRMGEGYNGGMAQVFAKNIRTV